MIQTLRLEQGKNLVFFEDFSKSKLISSRVEMSVCDIYVRIRLRLSQKEKETEKIRWHSETQKSRQAQKNKRYRDGLNQQEMMESDERSQH